MNRKEAAFIFTPPFPLGRVVGAATLEDLEILQFSATSNAGFLKKALWSPKGPWGVFWGATSRYLLMVLFLLDVYLKTNVGFVTKWPIDANIR